MHKRKFCSKEKAKEIKKKKFTFMTEEANKNNIYYFLALK